MPPRQELTRLGEIGAFILIRHADEPERITEFLRHWFNLALSHLQRQDIDEDVCDLAQGLSALAAAFDGNTERGRRQLLDLVGSGNERVFGPEIETATGQYSAIEALASKTVGQNAWLAALQNIRATRISLDDVRTFWDAFDNDMPIPRLPELSNNPNFERALTLISRDRRDLLHRGSRTTKSCPRCYRNLPVAALEDFKSAGIARTECCSGVLMRCDS